MPEANFGKVLVLLRKGYYLIFEQLLSNEATVTSWNFHNLFGFCSLEAFDYVGNYKIFKNITTICP